jgi:hypothetical protein
MPLYRLYYPLDPSFRFNPDLKRDDVIYPRSSKYARTPSPGWYHAGLVVADNLDHLYELTNIGPALAGVSRSLSVGDVILDTGTEALYQVDDVGFEEVN